MAGVLYIRDVDDDVIEALKQRAVEARTSLSAYVAAQLATIARRPTNAEIIGRARARVRQSTVTTADIVDAVRAGRDERTRGILGEADGPL